MAKVIATDLDGTLFYPKSRIHMIPKKNRRFLERFFADGGHLVVVTSRHRHSTDKIAQILDHRVDVIGLNGAFIECDGETIHEQFFEPQALTKLVHEVCDSISPALVMLSSKRYPVIRLKSQQQLLARIMYSIYQKTEGIYREPDYASDHLFYQEIERGEAMKLMVFIGVSQKAQHLAKVLTEKLQNEYPQFEFAWLNQLIEITPKGCNKANALSIYLDKLGISGDNVTVVGDSGNDVPMFRLFHEHSYCMAHAPVSVKAEATHVIRRVYDLEDSLYPSEDSNPS